MAAAIAAMADGRPVGTAGTSATRLTGAHIPAGTVRLIHAGTVWLAMWAAMTASAALRNMVLL
jgi:hypothetical protein